MSLIVTDNVSAVSFNNVALNRTIMEDTLKAVADAGIVVDMISMTQPTSEIFSFGFTVDDEDMPKLLGVVKQLREKDGVTPMINSSNRKIVIKNPDMEKSSGVAAKVLKVLNGIDAMILQITTGVDEISVLIRHSDGEAAEEALRAAFE